MGEFQPRPRLVNANFGLLLRLSSLRNATKSFLWQSSGKTPPSYFFYFYLFLKVEYLRDSSLNRSLSLLQKSKDIFSEIISALWKGHNNKIRFQIKDDVIERYELNTIPIIHVSGPSALSEFWENNIQF